MNKIKIKIWDKKLNKMWEPIELSMLLSYLLFKKCPNSDLYMAMKDHFIDMIFLQCSNKIDKNLKEIYQGDIVKYYEKNLIVGFANAHFMIFSGKELDDAYRGNHEDLWKALGDVSKENDSENKVLVIGNIYENPELLNEQK
jgi:uncharacterized phage protein (TIGR01671 family)